MITELGDQQVIVLKEIDGQRSFPIMIGTHEALAIDRRLKGLPTPRPMTHELLANVIDALGGQLESVLINDIHDHTFIATLFINRSGEIIEVDSRPSDAIALGVAFETPIYVADRVLGAVSGETSSRADRLEMLRQRATMLEERIDEFARRLADESFLAQTSQEAIDATNQQLQEMRTERDAIIRVLDKLG